MFSDKFGCSLLHSLSPFAPLDCFQHYCFYASRGCALWIWQGSNCQYGLAISWVCYHVPTSNELNIFGLINLITEYHWLCWQDLVAFFSKNKIQVKGLAFSSNGNPAHIMDTQVQVGGIGLEQCREVHKMTTLKEQALFFCAVFSVYFL